MKKLKRRNMFYGKTTPIIVTIFADLLVAIGTLIVLDELIESKLKYIFWAIGALALVFLSLYVYYLIIHRLTPEEKEKIAKASPPEWKQFPKTMKEYFTYDPKSFLTFAIVVIVIEIIISIFILSGTDWATMLWSLAVMVPVTVIAFLISAINTKKWAGMDETAIFTKIKIDHNFSVKEKSKSGFITTNYIVFYLPDGKYVLSCGSSKDIPKEIIVIKYKNLIRWENADKFKEYGGV